MCERRGFHLQFSWDDAVIELKRSVQRLKFFDGRGCKFSEAHFVQHLDKICRDNQQRKIVRKTLQTFVTLPKDLREVYRFLDRLAPCLRLKRKLYSLATSCYWR